MFNGKIHDFDWAIFYSYVSYYQRVCNVGITITNHPCGNGSYIPTICGDDWRMLQMALVYRRCQNYRTEMQGDRMRIRTLFCSIMIFDFFRSIMSGTSLISIITCRKRPSWKTPTVCLFCVHVHCSVAASSPVGTAGAAPNLVTGTYAQTYSTYIYF